MARQRNFRAEYQRRLSRGLERGGTRQEARGHGAAPERPIRSLSDPIRWQDYIKRRFDAIDALANTPAGARRLARFNAAREAEGKPRIVIGYPPDVHPGSRQFTYDTLEDAERHVAGVPPSYARIYLSPEGWTSEIDRSERRSRRRAA